MESDVAADFRSLWDQLEHDLQRRVGDTASFGWKLVDKACRCDPAVALYEPHLRNLLRLRNFLKHNEDAAALAVPTPTAIELVQTIVSILSLRAGDIAAEPVYSVTPDAALAAVASAMAANVYTAVPVIGEGQIIGVFSEATAVRLLARSSHVKITDAQTIGDIVEVLDRPDQSDPYAHYRCTTPRTHAADVFEWFSASTAKGIRLNAVFLTDTGSSDALPLGIVTAWDLRSLYPRKES